MSHAFDKESLKQGDPVAVYTIRVTRAGRSYEIFRRFKQMAEINDNVWQAIYFVGLR
jgi:hypothetical protein